jgi:Protein of unknown function (DUF3421)
MNILKNPRDNRIFKSLFLLVTILSLIIPTSCGIEDKVDKGLEKLDKTLSILDEGLKKFDSQSTSWRDTLEKTRDLLIEETQSTIKNEINDLLQNVLSIAGTEFRCNVDYLRNIARLELTIIRNKVAVKVNKPLLKTDDVFPTICGVTPEQVDISRVKSGGLLELTYAGYGLSRENVVVKLLDVDNQEINITSKLAQPSKFRLTLSVNPTGGVAFTEKSRFIVVQTTEKKEISSLHVQQPVTPPPAPAPLPAPVPVPIKIAVSLIRPDGGKFDLSKAAKGSEDSTLAVCVGNINGSYHAGKTMIGWTNCNVPFSNGFREAGDYYIVNGGEWIKAEGGNIPINAYSTTNTGSPVFICKAFTEGAWHPGKTVSGWNNCNIAYGNGRREITEFWVLK